MHQKYFIQTSASKICNELKLSSYGGHPENISEKYRSSYVLNMVTTVKMMEELESEPADDSRGYVHSFSSFPSLQSTHLTDA